MKTFFETCITCKISSHKPEKFKFIMMTGNWICKECYGSITDGLMYHLHSNRDVEK